MNYEKEYIRLWNAAEQALENIDFEKRLVASWAALRILKNAVDWGRDTPLPNQPVEQTATKLANEIELSVLSYLQDLGGFDHWWETIDHKLQGTIEQDLIDCIARHLLREPAGCGIARNV